MGIRAETKVSQKARPPTVRAAMEWYPDIPRSQASVLAGLIAILGLLALFSELIRG
jgi:hypothetical protein